MIVSRYTRYALEALPVAFVVAMTVVCLWQVSAAQAAAEAAFREEECGAAVRSYATAMAGAEAGRQGYMLTQDQDYLQSYYRGSTDAPVRLAALEGVVDADAFARLREAHAEKMADMRESVALVTAGRLPAAVAATRSGRGLALTVVIRSQTDAMLAAAAARAAAARDRTARSFRFCLLMVAAAAGFAVSTQAGSFLLTRQGQPAPRPETPAAAPVMAG